MRIQSSDPTKAGAQHKRLELAPGSRSRRLRDICQAIVHALSARRAQTTCRRVVAEAIRVSPRSLAPDLHIPMPTPQRKMAA